MPHSPTLDNHASSTEQEPLKDAGVNCLRAFPGQGLMVWGAGTLSTGGDWKYLSVLRLVNFLSDSIRSAAWTVSELYRCSPRPYSGSQWLP
ncbi:hypothetical protein [Streptomyces sp. NPDC005009]